MSGEVHCGSFTFCDAERSALGVSSLYLLLLVTQQVLPAKRGDRLLPLHRRFLFVSLAAISFFTLLIVLSGVVSIGIDNAILFQWASAMTQAILAWVRLTIGLFLAQGSVGSSAIRNSFLGGLVFAATKLLCVLLTLQYSNIDQFHHVKKHRANLQALLWIVQDFLQALLYAMLLVHAKRKGSPRRGIVLYATFEVLAYLTFAAVGTLFYMGKGLESAQCLQITTLAWHFSLWPIVLYLSLRADSQMWRQFQFKDGKGHDRAYRDTREALLSNDLHQSVKVLDFEDLEFHEQIGRGGTAVVFRGVLYTEKSAKPLPAAIKMTNCKWLDVPKIKRLCTEVNILTEIKHINIIHIFGISISPPQVHLVMEYASHGSLFDLATKKHTLFSDGQKAHFVCDTVHGLHRLHTNSTPVLHCDLKSLNLLLVEGWTLKLADFGESSLMSDAKTHRPGYTVNWSSPEVLRGEEYTSASDIYSLAMCVYEIHAGKVPFVDVESVVEVGHMVLGGTRPMLPVGEEEEAEKEKEKEKEARRGAEKRDENRAAARIAVEATLITAGVAVEARLITATKIGERLVTAEGPTLLAAYDSNNESVYDSVYDTAFDTTDTDDTTTDATAEREYTTFDTDSETAAAADCALAVAETDFLLSESVARMLIRSWDDDPRQRPSIEEWVDCARRQVGETMMNGGTSSRVSRSGSRSGNSERNSSGSDRGGDSSGGPVPSVPSVSPFATASTTDCCTSSPSRVPSCRQISRPAGAGRSNESWGGGSSGSGGNSGERHFTTAF